MTNIECDPESLSKIKSIRRIILVTGVLALLIVIWGAFVRISGSGNGCGESWPLCKGKLFPDANINTYIEYIHRSTSGIFLILSIYLPFFVRKKLGAKHAAYFGAKIFTLSAIIEALIGAALVLGSLVANNDSLFRAGIMAIHLMNTFFMFASLTLTWALTAFKFPVVNWKQILLLGLIPALYSVAAILGGIASLAGTLFPSDSLAEGLIKDFNSSSHPLLKLRILHPLAGIVFLAVYLYLTLKEESKQTLLKPLSYLIIFHVGFGVASLLSLSPVWMKLSHLLLVELIWISICYVIFYANIEENISYTPKPLKNPWLD